MYLFHQHDFRIAFKYACKKLFINIYIIIYVNELYFLSIEVKIFAKVDLSLMQMDKYI